MNSEQCWALGRYGMLTPTSYTGDEMIRWLQGGAGPLYLVDSYFNDKKRATFQQSNLGKSTWFELDTLAADTIIVKRTQKMSTFSMGFSDHKGKQYVIALGTAKALKKIRREAKEEQDKKPLLSKLLLGPSERAKTTGWSTKSSVQRNFQR